MSLGKNIQKLRKENKLSQEQLAQKCNVSRQTISRWESDEVLPDTNNLITLAKLFNVTLDSMVFDEEQSMDLKIEKKKFNWKSIGIVSIILNLIIVIGLIVTLNPFSKPKTIEGIYYVKFAVIQELVVKIEQNEKGLYTKIYLDDNAYPIAATYISQINSVVGEMIDYELYTSTKNPTFTIRFSKKNPDTIQLDAKWISNTTDTFYLTRQ